MELGQLIGSGRSADVFAIDDEWVLRRQRDGADTTAEAAVMAYLAERGYPVPEVRPGARRTDLVMRRLYGPTLAAASVGGDVGPTEAGTILAGLLEQLHRVPARVSGDPADRVLHLDLHPENVVLTSRGPRVIDWSNTVEGPAELDWAMSALILAQVAVDAAGDMAEGVRAILSTLLGGRTDVASWPMDRVRRMRMANPTMSPREVGLIDEAVDLVGELAGR